MKLGKYQSSYQNYLQKKEHITFEEMQRIFNDILESVDEKDLEFMEIWEDVIHNSIKYTQIRAEWNFYDKDKKMEVDSMRTHNHNIVIDSFIILERYMISKNWNVEWTKLLFMEDTAMGRVREDISNHRKRIGDFANFLTFIYALQGR